MKTVELKVNESLIVNVLPSNEYEFLMSTKDVAKGYDVNANTLRMHMHRHSDELKENMHFIKGITNSDTYPKVQPTQVFWTKSGIIRLGMFIRSERAIMFRDWAERVILDHLSSTPISKPLPPSPKRKHNRLTQERLLSIMQDVCMIEDFELRNRISNKLLG